jgi:hypothetical protein
MSKDRTVYKKHAYHCYIVSPFYALAIDQKAEATKFLRKKNAIMSNFIYQTSKFTN